MRKSESFGAWNDYTFSAGNLNVFWFVFLSRILIHFVDSFKNLNSQPIQENLSKLIENSRALMQLVTKYNFEIDSFSSIDCACDDGLNSHKAPNSDEVLKLNNSNPTALSASSSSSSAISSGSELPNNLQQQIKHQNQESPILKNMIVSNLVTYSYEIAYTVKRIVCIMGADI